MNKGRPSYAIEFTEATSPITIAVTKFGGAPNWIAKAQWPTSRRLGTPMIFIGQLRIADEVFPGARASMAYIFIAEDPEETWDPDAGENAVILQPGNIYTPCAALDQGPSLTSSDEHGNSVAKEFAVTLKPRTEPAYVPEAGRRTWTPDEYRDYARMLSGNKIGGSPLFTQNDHFPFEPWQLLLQLDSMQVPFDVNFGTGCGYVIADATVSQAKLLWQR